jgi:cathepsin L
MFALLVSLSFSAFVYPHEEKSFLAHMRFHGLLFTGEEYHLRLGIYLAIARFIRETNAAGHGFTLSANHLATLTPAEYRALIGPPRSHPSPPAVIHRVADPPASWDWRDKGAVQAVKDQGVCSAGYAFAAIAAAESAWFIKHGVMFNLSEQNIIDCDTSSSGCGGGLPDSAFLCVLDYQGGFFSTEEGYPYVGEQGECNFVQGPASLKDFMYVGGGNETLLQVTVYNNGPVACAVNASPPSFHVYSSGVYDDPRCVFWDTDHSVLTVGYGSNSDADYWIVKNSWGVKWGMEGYMLIKRNDGNECGIASSGVVPVVN